MLRWSQALLDGRVLSPESMKKLWAPHVSRDLFTWDGGIRPPKLVHFETGPDGKMRLRLGEALATIFPVGE